MNEQKKSVQFEVTTKTVTKVRIEFADGTYSELDDLEECRKWQQMTMQQATAAFVHGYTSPALNWKRGGREGEESELMLSIRPVPEKKNDRR